MRVFTLTFLAIFFSSTIVLAQGMMTKTKVAPSSTTIVDKMKSHDSDATDYTINFDDEIEWTFDFMPWTVNDVDMLDTYGFTSYTFPHTGEAMA